MPKDSIVATCATKGYPQKCPASSTRSPSSTRGHGETCSRPNDDNTPKKISEFKVYHMKNLNTTTEIVGNNITLEDLGVQSWLLEAKDAMIAVWQGKHPFTPFSEDSKRLNQTPGNVEGFEIVPHLSQRSMPYLSSISGFRNRPTLADGTRMD